MCCYFRIFMTNKTKKIENGSRVKLTWINIFLEIMITDINQLRVNPHFLVYTDNLMKNCISLVWYFIFVYQSKENWIVCFGTKIRISFLKYSWKLRIIERNYLNFSTITFLFTSVNVIKWINYTTIFHRLLF